LDARFPKPCDDTRVREAKAGFSRAEVEYHLSRDPVRVPIRAPVAWALARRAFVATAERRRRQTALLCHVWWLRRGSNVALLAVGNVEPQADGTPHYVVLTQSTEAARALLAHSQPAPRPQDARLGGDLNPPHTVLRRLLGDLARRAISTRLFTASKSTKAASLSSGWQLAQLQQMGGAAPVGTLFGSHSPRSGGPTATFASGVPRGATAELSGKTERTVAVSYIAELTLPTILNRLLIGPLLPRAA